MATATSVEALLPGDHACLMFSDRDCQCDLPGLRILETPGDQ